MISIGSKNLLVILFLLSVIGFAAGQEPAKDVSNAATGPLKACWTPESLLPKPSDSAIKKGVPAAYLPPPSLKGARTPERRGYVGAVRRVELPAQAGKLIALTFDLCEQPNEIAGYDSQIVGYLRTEGVRATFFAGGKWMLTHETPTQQLMGDPLFELGNHTWEHRNLRLVSGADLEKEILAPQVAYQGVRAKLQAKQCLDRNHEKLAVEHAARSLSLFRFPFGGCNPAALEAVAKAGLQAVQWDVSSGDPSFGLSPGRMAEAVVNSVRPGSIVLFHANGRGWHTAAALPEIVARLKVKGYRFVTVGELLRVPGAKWDIRPICFDSKPGDADHYDEFARRLEVGYQKFLSRYGSSALRKSSVPTPQSKIEQPLAAPQPVPAHREP